MAMAAIDQKGPLPTRVPALECRRALLFGFRMRAQRQVAIRAMGADR
jgi:hypothetical protein